MKVPTLALPPPSWPLGWGEPAWAGGEGTCGSGNGAWGVETRAGRGGGRGGEGQPRSLLRGRDPRLPGTEEAHPRGCAGANS